MDDKYIAFITAVNDEEKYKECINYINKLIVPIGYRTITVPIYSDKSMCHACNLGIKYFDLIETETPKYKVYLHQDLLITDKEFLIKMIDAFKSDSNLGMLGVAGCINMPDNGVWWEGKIAGVFIDDHAGFPYEYKYIYSNTEVIKVKAIDGCLMCTQYDIPWREDLFTGWDFYDISQSYEFSNKGYSIGIIPSDHSLINHKCGECNMTNYETYRRIFVDEYLSNPLKFCVACPDGATGGIELLHQFVYELNQHKNVNAYIWYCKERLNCKMSNHEAYNKYNNPYITGIDVDDDMIMVFPEIWAYTCNRKEYKDNKKIIYWESVDNYLDETPKHLRNIFPENVLHIVQSYYAYDFLVNTYKIDKSKILFVTDYLNDIYFEHYKEEERLDQIVYNPKKGYEYTKQLIELLPDVKFVPINNLSFEQVVNLLRHSKLYIDFGKHPGKDRIPREAAMCGCCVITGKKGSAKFKEDVNIPEYYKFSQDENIYDKSLIYNKIKYILENYELCREEFNEYREGIKKEKLKFKHEVKELINYLRQ